MAQRITGGEQISGYVAKQNANADEIEANSTHADSIANPHAVTAAQAGAETPAGAQAKVNTHDDDANTAAHAALFAATAAAARDDDTPIVFDANMWRAINSSTGAITTPAHINGNRFVLPMVADANNSATMGNGFVLPASWTTARLVALWEVTAAAVQSFMCWGVYLQAAIGGSVNGAAGMTSQTVSADVANQTLQRLVLGTVDVSAGGHWKFGFRRQGSDAADDFAGTVFFHALLVEKAA